MQVNQTNKASAVSGLSGDAGFTANMDATAFQVMIGNLYKDKPRAVVRETIANCRDAHNWRDLMYGSVTREKLSSGLLTSSEEVLVAKLQGEGYALPGTPYEIHVPTDLEPWLEFTDYGIGLTLEEAIGEVDENESDRAGHIGCFAMCAWWHALIWGTVWI